MATVTKLPGLRHLRSDPSSHVLRYRKGKLVRSGRGLAFWFLPLSASMVEIPCDDRDQSFLFHARSRDYQDVTTQGVITFRVLDAEKLAQRIDFTDLIRAGTKRLDESPSARSAPWSRRVWTTVSIWWRSTRSSSATGPISPRATRSPSTDVESATPPPV